MMQLNVNVLSDQYDFFINGVSYAGKPKNNTMMYISKKVSYLLQNLYDHEECLVFVEKGVFVPDALREKNCIIFSDNPQLAYAEFAMKYANEQKKEEKEWGYTLTREGYYIGHNVIIGKNAYIEPNVLIGHNVIIGDNAVVLKGSVIKHSSIGNNFIANEYSVIGAQGFTMTENLQYEKLRIPTLGKVLIGDNVEVGVHDNVSCGSAGNTVIENNVKLDAEVHVGHDVIIGEGTEITAGVIVGGYVTIGKHTFVGINSVIRNRVAIGNDAVIGMGSVVVKSVADAVTVVGNPASILRK